MGGLDLGGQARSPDLFSVAGIDSRHSGKGKLKEVSPDKPIDSSMPSQVPAPGSNGFAGDSPTESHGAEDFQASPSPLVSDAVQAERHSEGAAVGVAALEGDSPVVDATAQPVADAASGESTEEPPRSALAEWAITILLLLFLTTTLVQAYVIPTGSMEDTLLIGDHLLVDKLAFAPTGPVSKYLLPYTEVKRGDIIVFRYPVDIKQTFVKRVMGVPGDHIKVVNKEVYLNGQKLVEPYRYLKTDYLDAYRDNFPTEPNVWVDRGAIDMLRNHVQNGEVVVPPNSYFAMGDNRDSSLDSRYWGFVPRENIIGKPLIIYWSFDAPSDHLQDPNIGMDHLLDVGKNFFSKTRWNRTFRLIHGYPVGSASASSK
jgi:signal peptidase I